MRYYETIYILNPNLSDEEYHEIIEKFNKLIEAQKGIIIRRQEWGKQRLAYAINKFNNGYYVLIAFCAEPGLTAELERNFKIDDRILKYQTIKIADNADAQELLLKEKEAPKEIKESVPVSAEETGQEYGFQEDEESLEGDSEVENGD